MNIDIITQKHQVLFLSMVENLMERAEKLERRLEEELAAKPEWGDNADQGASIEKVQDLQEALSAATGRLVTAETERDAAEKRLEEQRSAESARADDYEATIEALTAARDFARNEERKLRSKFKAKQQDHTDAVKQIHALREERDMRTGELAAAEKLLDELSEERDSSSQRIGDLLDELKDARGRVDELTAEIKEYEKELDDSEKDRARLAVDLANLKKTTDQPTTPGPNGQNTPGQDDARIKSIRRHLEAAIRQFEEDPDKSLIALNRALDQATTKEKNR